MLVGSESFVTLVYPVTFEPDMFDELSAGMDRARWGELENLWTPATVPTEDLLRSVGEFLEPPPGARRSARVWRLDGNALQSTRGLGAGGSEPWEMVTRSSTIPFQLKNVHLGLLQPGVALLSLRLTPQSQEPNDWFDFMHFARFQRRPERSRLRMRRRKGINATTREPEYEPFFPPPAGGVAAHPQGEGTLGEIITALLSSASAGKHWWHEVYVPGQLIPYSALFFEGVPAEEQLRFLLRLEAYFHARQELHPSPADLDLQGENRVAYARDQYFVLTLDGSSFVAFDAPQTPFFRETLPAHLRSEYFILFLMTLYQRFALMLLEDEISSGWALGTDDEQRETVLRKVRDRLLMFTAQGHFTQVVQRQHHHRCYRRWQEIFQIDQLYAEVHRAASDMHDYLEAKRDSRIQTGLRRVDVRMRQIAFLLAPPSLALSFLNAAGWANPWTAVCGIAGGMTLGWLASSLVQKQLDRRFR
jgi:hypothetical protein